MNLTPTHVKSLVFNRIDWNNRVQVVSNGLLLLLAGLILLSGNGCGRSEASENALGDDKAKVILDKKYIRDPGTRNIKSHSLFVPRGWTLTGGTKWESSKYYRLLPSNDISIRSPSNVEVNVYRTFAYSDPRPSSQYQYQYGLRRPAEGSSDGGYPVRKLPDSVSEWKSEIKNKLMREKRPDAVGLRIKNVTDFPELTNMLKKINGMTLRIIDDQNRQARSYGLNSSTKMTIKTYVFEMEYSEDGTEFEEILIFGVVDTVTKIPGITQINWNVCPKISYRAPKGDLEKNMPLLLTLTSSIKPTAEWSEMLFKHIARMNKIDRDAFNKRMKLHRETWSEINRIQNEGNRNYQAAMDETHRKVINCIRGTSDYSHDGEEFQLPSGYDHVYTNGYDSIVLTNDALFDPNVDLQGSLDWSAMKKVR